MEGHVRALGVIYIVMGVLLVIVGLFLTTVVVGSGLLSGDRTAMLTTGAVGTWLAALFVALSLPSIAAGFGLLKFRNWGRVLAIIIGVLNLFGFPIGTAIGVYTLYVLLSEQTAPLFASNRPLPVRV